MKVEPVIFQKELELMAIIDLKGGFMMNMKTGELSTKLNEQEVINKLKNNFYNKDKEFSQLYVMAYFTAKCISFIFWTNLLPAFFLYALIAYIIQFPNLTIVEIILSSVLFILLYIDLKVTKGRSLIIHHINDINEVFDIINKYDDKPIIGLVACFIAIPIDLIISILIGLKGIPAIMIGLDFFPLLNKELLTYHSTAYALLSLLLSSVILVALHILMYWREKYE